jgi:hypothetical protein
LRPSLLSLLLGLAAAACEPTGSGPPPRFPEVARASGVDFRHENGARGKRHMPETTSGGAAWLDYDGDERFDLYLASGNVHAARGGDGDTPGRLFKNVDGSRFRDVTEAAGLIDRGYATGLAVGDHDNDGKPDLYLTRLGSNALHRNESGTFRDITGSSRTAAAGWSSCAAFLDHDLDGDLDLYVGRYVDYDPAVECQEGGQPAYCSPHKFPGLPDVLFRNEGGGVFADVSRSAGIAVAGPHEGKTLGIAVLDHDDDGDPDVFTACDQVPSLLFRNNRDGTFTEVGLLANVAYGDDGNARAGMGVDAGDIDLDGRLDLVVTNFADEPCSVFRALGEGSFLDEARRLDVARYTLEPLGFGVLLIDHDLDGDLDLYVANGHVQDSIALLRPGRGFGQKDLLLDNLEGKLFADISAAAGEWFGRAEVSRSAASCDLDGDGDEDIAVTVSGGQAVLLRNETRSAHWIALRLEGTRSNRDGHGARVTLHGRRASTAFTRVAQCQTARSYASACDPRVRFGLGAGDVQVERIEIRWPLGALQVLEAPAIDRVHRVKEPVQSPSNHPGL